MMIRNHTLKTAIISLIVFALIMLTLMNCSYIPDYEPILPIPKIYIHTTNGVPIVSKENYVNATFSLSGEGVYDNISETKIRIRGRGNSTWAAPKKPYRLNFNTAISLFGLPADRNWVLLANYYDQTHLFNAVAFELGHRLNMPFTNHSFFVELYINNSCQGLYLLTEHLSRNVALENNDMLMELDVNFDEDFKFYSDIINLPVMMQNPSTQAGLDRAKVVWKNVENTLFGDVYENAPNILDSNGGWRELFDIQSIMEYILIYELTGNLEPYYHPKSFYTRYTANDGKIHFGPIWDFDYAWIMYNNNPEAVSWIYYREGSNLSNRYSAGWKFLGRFFDDPKFVRQYKQYSNSVIGKLDVNRFIDSLAAVLEPYAEKDYKIWDKSYNYDVQIVWLKHFFNRKFNAFNNYIKN